MYPTNVQTKGVCSQQFMFYYGFASDCIQHLHIHLMLNASQAITQIYYSTLVILIYNEVHHIYRLPIFTTNLHDQNCNLWGFF